MSVVCLSCFVRSVCSVLFVGCLVFVFVLSVLFWYLCCMCLFPVLCFYLSDVRLVCFRVLFRFASVRFLCLFVVSTVFLFCLSYWLFVPVRSCCFVVSVCLFVLCSFVSVLLCDSVAGHFVFAFVISVLFSCCLFLVAFVVFLLICFLTVL